MGVIDMDISNASSIHHLLASIWFFIVGLFLVFYVMLDGFDLGVGILSLFANERRRKVMMSSLGSIWDANETWLVVVGGTLFGAFPLAYGTVLNGLYIPIIAMLLGLMLRGVSFEFHEHSERKALWGAMFGVGSLLAAMAQGFALGGLLSGVRVVNGLFAGTAWDWFTPFSMVCVLGVLSGYSMLGSTYLIMKTGDDIQAPCFARGKFLAWLVLAVGAIVTVWTPLQFPEIFHRWLSTPNIYFFATLPAFALLSFVMLLRALKRHAEVAPFVWTLLIFLFSFAGLAATWFPYIVPDSVTIDQAAAASNTLIFMLVGIGMLIPVMVTYNVYQYLVFRGKINADEEHAY
jgi:cytochrome d ubiquinol oxidase subunit II